MLQKKVWSIFMMVSLFVAGLAGCGIDPQTTTGGSGTDSSPIVSISLTPPNASFAKYTSQQFTATATHANTRTSDVTATVTWTSSDETKATIDKPGHVIGKGVGSAHIKASSGDVSGETTVTVSEATLVSIALTPTNPGIAKGTTQQFNATGTFSDNTTQDLTASVIWSSSNTGAAAVSNAAGSQGLAASIAAGSTTITATSGNISGSTTLTVTPAVLVSVAITPTNLSIAKGTTRQLTATGTFSDNTSQDLTASATWTSSNTDAATVSNAAGSQGLAGSVAAGSTTITATSGSISGSTTLTVTQAVLVSIAITPTNPSIAKGTGKQFTATGTYSDGTTQNLTTTVTWSSLNAGTATISNAAGSQGLAGSVAAGSTTITATSGSISGSTTLTVTQAVLVSVAITPSSQNISVGATQQFSATGAYSDSTTQNLTTTVTWSSSNTGMATISNAAGSKGLAIAVASGTTTITAVSGNISATAALTVTGSSTATLTWDAPTTRSDGSPLNPLTDLYAYKIHYGTLSQSYTQTVTVINPGTTPVTYTLNLGPGSYYFSVTAVDASGQESSFSNEASKTL